MPYIKYNFYLKTRNILIISCYQISSKNMSKQAFLMYLLFEKGEAQGRVASKIEYFVTLINGFQSFTNVVKNSILDVVWVFGYASKMLHPIDNIKKQRLRRIK